MTIQKVGDTMVCKELKKLKKGVYFFFAIRQCMELLLKLCTGNVILTAD